MDHRIDFTSGKIVGPLLKFAVPVLFAMFLQAMYGAVDLMIVGKFAASADVSAVSTGSQIMMTMTNLISSLCMGMTIFLGQKIGEKKADQGGRIIGSGLLLFLAMGALLTVLMPVFSPKLAGVMHAPKEAFDLTVTYIRICGAGALVIIAYNLIGGIFRGIGDSATPLMTVAIACVVNIAGDLFLVAGLHLGTMGAAIATVGAQLVSVVISGVLISRKELPFELHLHMIRFEKDIIRKILVIGIPIALQDLLVGVSFLVILSIVNGLGLIASAGVGVAEKVCGFIMLVPAAFMQSMSAFVAQNRGAGKFDRALRGFRSAVLISCLFGACMFYLAFSHGNILSGIFSNDGEVVAAAWDYLKAYAIDCLLTCFLFCFIGFFNGMGNTAFVMLQGVFAAFAVRVPVSYFMSKWEPVSLFKIGLAIPCSTVVQIVICFAFLAYIRRKWGKERPA